MTTKSITELIRDDNETDKLIERLSNSSVIPTVHECLRAAAMLEQQAARIAALESAAKAEPIYQTCFIQGQWRDVDRFEYERAKGLRDDLARIVYTAPTSAGDGRDAWQPIETAPKDGTPLILFARAKHATASAPVFGWWHRDIGWIESAFSTNYPVGIVPSHWMPRPEFPAALSQQGEQV